MVKLTFCLHRLSSLSLAEFQDYWLNKHGPLVRRLQPSLRMARYVQVHRLDGDLVTGMQRVRGAPEPFDGIAELWWTDEETFRAAGRDPQAREAGRLLLEDEAKFIDLARSVAEPRGGDLFGVGCLMLRRNALGAGIAALWAGRAWAQTPYPSKPIRLVIGYAPGGGNDLIARIVAAKLQEKLGQPVVVENKPGAQSIVAAEIVAKAPPDGYTLLVAPSGVLSINPAVYSKLPYDPAKDFAPVSLLAEFPLVLVVGPDQPVKSVQELVAYGRANPKLANYASAATAFQLASELFNQRTDSHFQYIPYKGSGEMAQAVMSGQVLMAIADSGPLAGPLKGGKLRALAVTTAKRSADFPDVPTLAEVGIPDMEISLWTGIVAPAGTPADIVSRLQKAIADSIALPDVRAALAAIAVDPRSTTAEEYRDLISRDTARWKAVATKANIKLD